MTFILVPIKIASMLMGFILFLLIVCVLWLAYLTFSFFKLSSHYNRLLKTGDAKSLSSVFESLLSDVSVVKKDIEKLKLWCDTIEKQGQVHVQKIGLERFNPFNDTGSDQSFILVLVDARDTGVVISSLYSRGGTRWYAKRIVEGKGVDHELSHEEQKALKQATA